ncbi:MAG: glutathione peroxidase [Sutterellaceae bacterium]|nr:glutathione peroxidase [Burkholderiaceae bacterium]MCX7901802.1 glutathione peroxidase [Burkholderiaceae bacterium]MDW8429462.1 glutathione peroxidase [Sutterellaceae bacterium]
MSTVYDFSATTIDGRQQTLSVYQGKVLLIVNTASQCGFTPQHAGLQMLHERYADRGFAVLGFPCNQFGGQEPGDEAQIAQFCQTRYRVSFPLFAKVDVNGETAHPLFVYLKAAAPGLLGSEAIKWNFTKFLVDRSGRVVKRYAPQTDPLSIAPDIEALLAS